MKLTPAQATLLHVGESAASSALWTLLIGIVQQLATGQVSVAGLGTVFGSGFIAAFGLVYKSVKASSKLAQGEADTAEEIKQWGEAPHPATPSIRQPSGPKRAGDLPGTGGG